MYNQIGLSRAGNGCSIRDTCCELQTALDIGATKISRSSEQLAGQRDSFSSNLVTTRFRALHRSACEPCFQRCRHHRGFFLDSISSSRVKVATQLVRRNLIDPIKMSLELLPLGITALIFGGCCSNVCHAELTLGLR